MIIQNVLPAIHLPSTSPGPVERAEANSSQLLLAPRTQDK